MAICSSGFEISTCVPFSRIFSLNSYTLPKIKTKSLFKCFKMTKLSHREIVMTEKFISVFKCQSFRKIPSRREIGDGIMYKKQDIAINLPSRPNNKTQHPYVYKVGGCNTLYTQLPDVRYFTSATCEPNILTFQHIASKMIYDCPKF